MKYTFRHTAIIDHEIEADNIVAAKKKFFSDVAESSEFFTTAKKVVTDERIKILNENEDHIDTFNIYDDV
ncbi:MAG: hypothetical protein GQ546_06460 [Gammaproteobacteria bacterium]|jgi:hypothetical protein|nr:hypothetical protein [Gammaproteobacteria bacterium]